MSTSISERFQQVNTARKAVLDHLLVRGKSGDKTVKPYDPGTVDLYGDFDEGFSVLPHGWSGSGSIPCPVCRTGTLSYTRSSYNLHIHAHCSNAGCVSWME